MRVRDLDNTRHRHVTVALLIMPESPIPDHNFNNLVTPSKSPQQTMPPCKYVQAPSDILEKGLRFLGIVGGSGKSSACKSKIFCKHFGSSPVCLAAQWYDICTVEVDPLPASKQCLKGLRIFLVAHFFLWTYPKNSDILASRFKLPERYMRGKNLWEWIERIQALKRIKITWNERFDDPDSEVFLVTVDGTDCRTCEKKHPTLSQDRRNCSHKFKHAALKYEVGISVFEARVVWINGPYRGGQSDLNMLRHGGLLDKIVDGKKAIADRGYHTGVPDERRKLSLPNAYDSKVLNNFKSRARLRHETFNGRIKFFKVLANTFEHGLDKHKIAFEAVAVTVQYQMEHGSPIYSV